jgi:hypothetical protein
MTRDSLALGRGLVLGAIWLVWLAGGYIFAGIHHPIGEWLSNAAPLEKLGFAVWVVTSTALLACAIMYCIRAFTRPRREPRA